MTTDVVVRSRVETEIAPKTYLDDVADVERISPSTVVVDESGDPVLGALQLDLSDRAVYDRILALKVLLRKHVRFESFSNEGRLSGISVMHQTFGFAARQPLRHREMCTSTQIMRDQPQLQSLLDDILALDLAPLFHEWFPDAAARHREIVESSVHPHWLLAGTPFSSGIINQDASLPYHRDSNNFDGTWSLMLVVRRKTDGGDLHVPELDVVVRCTDASVVIFNGNRLLHGVTPLRLRGSESYRYSCVWYAPRGFARALPPGEEMDEGRRIRTAREDRMAADLRATAVGVEMIVE